jgi:peptidoglycan/LPS O-acetylase OafA/YrhL
MNNNSLAYRNEIDGLRAFAVLPVVVNHVSEEFLSAGFLGVDVFFVISGFIISRQILSSLHSGSFSLLDFYERRARRIFPALFFTIFLTICGAIVLLLPSDLQRASTTAIGALSFTANFVLWRQLDTGYFAAMEEALNPFVHLWSLSVEEQFYVIFPFVLLVCIRLRWRALLLSIITFMLASLVLMAYWHGDKPVATFFLTPFRAWELLAGAFLAVLERRGAFRPSNTILGLGLILILSSYSGALSSGESHLVAQITSVFGASLVILSGVNCGLSRAVLCNVPTRYVGKISYSLYLVHWPLIVFLSWTDSSGRAHSVSSLVLVITSSIALAALLERYVEQPFRNRAFLSRGSIFLGSTICIVLLLALAASSRVMDGFSSRFEESIRRLDAARVPSTLPKYLQCETTHSSEEHACKVGNISTQPITHIISDSHGFNYISTIDATLSSIGGSSWFSPRPACPPLIFEGSEVEILGLGGFCAARSEQILKIIERSSSNRVILIANWLGYFDPNLLRARGEGHETAWLEERASILTSALRRTVARMTEAGIKVVIWGPTPIYQEVVPLAHLKSILFGRPIDPISRSASFFRARVPTFFLLMDEMSLSGVIEYYDMLSVLCRTEDCLTKVGNDAIYFDSNHLTRFGESLFAQRTRELMDINNNERF